MKGKKKKAGFIVVISLLGVLAVMAVVYATLSTTLNISTSDAKIEPNPLNVVFDLSDAATSCANSDNVNPGTLSLSDDKRSVSLNNVTWYNDLFINFRHDILVKNEGTVAAKLKSITCTNAVPDYSAVTIYLGTAGNSTPGSGLTTYVNSYSGANSTTTLSSPITLNPGQYIPFSVEIGPYNALDSYTSKSIGPITVTPHWEAVTS